MKAAYVRNCAMKVVYVRNCDRCSAIKVSFIHNRSTNVVYFQKSAMTVAAYVYNRAIKVAYSRNCAM